MAPRLAFIDHSFHQKSTATRFLIDLLKNHYEVKVFWDESWIKGPGIDHRVLNTKRFDTLLFFQMLKSEAFLNKLNCKDIIFVPMFDASRKVSDKQWRRFEGVKFLNFSKTLHDKLANLSITSKHVQYFLPPHLFEFHRQDSNRLNGFFWQRTNQITWKHLRKLINGTKFDSIHIHTATDPPGYRFVRPDKNEMDQYSISMSKWFSSKSDYFEVLKQSNVFFAPRLFEGIGMSFIEAMAMGKCVVAPDNPTMNEYIVNGVNGILFDPSNPKPLDFSNIEKIWKNVDDFVQNGYRIWLEEENNLMEFITAGPGKTVKTSLMKQASQQGRAFSERNNQADKKGTEISNSPDSTPAKGENPLISIVTVTLNSKEQLPKTIQSVIEQNYKNIEYIIIDGGSTDGTVDIIREYEKHIDYWVSEKDNGVYEAMNKAIDAASGKYINFMNAGDWFYSPNVLKKIFANYPEDADIIYGNNYYRNSEGRSILMRANYFEDTWQNLISDNIDSRWLQGIPCHQTLFSNASLLKKIKYNTSFKICADHAFMFWAFSQGRRFYHSNQIVAVYTDGGLSRTHQIHGLKEKWRCIKKYHNSIRLNGFFLNYIGRVLAMRNKSLSNLLGKISSALTPAKPVGVVTEEAYDLKFLEGWYHRETKGSDWWHWTGKKGFVQINMHRETNACLKMELISSRNPNVVDVTVNGKNIDPIKINHSGFNKVDPISLSLKKGINKISFISTEKPVRIPPKGGRLLGIGIKNLIIDVGRTIIFLHIPKTAGTAIQVLLNRNFNRDVIYQMDNSDAQQSMETFKKLSSDEKRKYRVIIGHMWFGLHEHHPEPSSYITVLRDPVDRVISHYYYVLRTSAHYLHNVVTSKNLTLAEYVESKLSTELNNGQTRLLSGEMDEEAFPFGECPENLLEKAKFNLKNYFSVIGIQEKFDQTLKLFKKVHHINMVDIQVNVTPNRPAVDQIPEDTINIIKHYNLLDIELYEYALSLFNASVEENQI